MDDHCIRTRLPSISSSSTLVPISQLSMATADIFGDPSRKPAKSKPDLSSTARTDTDTRSDSNAHDNAVRRCSILRSVCSPAFSDPRNKRPNETTTQNRLPTIHLALLRELATTITVTTTPMITNGQKQIITTASDDTEDATQMSAASPLSMRSAKHAQVSRNLPHSCPTQLAMELTRCQHLCSMSCERSDLT